MATAGWMPVTTPAVEGIRSGIMSTTFPPTISVAIMLMMMEMIKWTDMTRAAVTGRTMMKATRFTLAVQPPGWFTGLASGSGRAGAAGDACEEKPRISPQVTVGPRWLGGRGYVR